MSCGRVIVTGAEGLIGSVLRRGWTGAPELAPMTLRPEPFSAAVGDITVPGTLDAAFRGAEAVVHLAAAAALDAPWEQVLAVNIVGTRNVYEAAVRAGVKTVVFASSGHVIGAAEEQAGPGLYALTDRRQYDEHTPPAPDSAYAVSKLFGENAGRYYADRFGLRVVCIRFGTVLPDDDPGSAVAGRGRSALMPFHERYPRIRAKWLSHRDCCQLVRCAIEAEAVRFALVFGTSNNPRQIWSLDPARRLLGYKPQDAAPVEIPAPGGVLIGPGKR